MRDPQFIIFSHGWPVTEALRASIGRCCWEIKLQGAMNH